MTILNTMQHSLTNQQSDQLTDMGHDWDSIVSLKELDPDLFAGVSNCPADERILQMLAERLANVIMDGYEAVILPIGSPAFMFILSRSFGSVRPKFLFAHTERMSEDQRQDDGTVKKVSIFKHIKWIVL